MDSLDEKMLKENKNLQNRNGKEKEDKQHWASMCLYMYIERYSWESEKDQIN